MLDGYSPDLTRDRLCEGPSTETVLCATLNRAVGVEFA